MAQVKFIKSGMVVRYANVIGDICEMDDSIAAEFVEMGVVEYYSKGKEIIGDAIVETTEALTTENVETATKKVSKKGK